MGNYFKSGVWNCICDVCGREYKSNEVRKRWDGLMVCPNDYEDRHILDFIRVPPERGSVPWVAPECDDVFVYVCYLEASQGIADTGQANCARADTVLSAKVLADLL